MKNTKYVGFAKSLRTRLFGGAAALVVMLGDAIAGPSLPSGGGDLFQKARAWFQYYLDFMSGPFGYAVVALSAIVVLAVYAVAPKEGIMGNGLRVVVSGLGILNVAIIMGSFT